MMKVSYCYYQSQRALPPYLSFFYTKKLSLHFCFRCDVHDTRFNTQQSAYFPSSEVTEASDFQYLTLRNLSSDHAKARDRHRPTTHQLPSLQANHGSISEFPIRQPINIQRGHHVPLLRTQHHPMPIKRLDMRLCHFQSRRHSPYHHRLSLLRSCLELIVDFSVHSPHWALPRQRSLPRVTKKHGSWQREAANSKTTTRDARTRRNHRPLADPRGTSRGHPNPKARRTHADRGSIFQSPSTTCARSRTRTARTRVSH